jgi:hypothetical protein
MVSGGFFSSDLYRLYNVVQNTQILQPKILLISALREYFAQDTKYHYVNDEWGFPKTPDHTDLNPKAGLNDDDTTRIYIGQDNRFDIKYYPAVLIRNTGSSYFPISINQDEECVEYGYRLYIDGYGNKTSLRIPVNFIFAGAWDLTFDIDVIAEGPQDRSTIVEAINMHLQSNIRNQLTYAGLFIKNVRTGAESQEIYQNDNVYKQTISLECRGEYRRLIPITDVVEIISACIEIGHTDNNNVWLPALNETIYITLDLTNTILQTTPL